MFLITPVFDFGHKFSAALTDSIIKVTNSTSGVENKISSAVMESMSNNSNMKKEDKEQFVKIGKQQITMQLMIKGY